MATTATAIDWNWVIEALANFEQVDTSTLVGLVKVAPGKLGKDAREMVSIRILESLFLHSNGADGDSAQNAKTSFDASKHCEDVLQQILNETPELMAKLEKQKWDVRPFLTHKRSSMPKYMLKKLKEAILESSHPALASLKERSRLSVPGNTRMGGDGAQDTVKDDSTSLNPREDKKKFKQKVLQEADRVRNSVGELTRRVKCEMVGERPLEGSNGNKLMEHDARVTSETLLQSCDTASLGHDQQQLHCDDVNSPQGTYREGRDKRVLVHKPKGPKNGIEPRALDGEPSSVAKNITEYDGQVETTTDSVRAVDENTDKEAFLNSPGTPYQDSLEMSECLEINLCMKCNEGGQMLVCSSDACMLQFHESCLGSVVTIDENGKFFCPFCAYSRAISKYLEAKRKASLARKDLQAFSSFTVRHRHGKPSKKQSALVINEDGRLMGAVGETTKGNGNGDTVNRANNTNCMSNKGDSLIPLGEKEATVGGVDNSMLPEPSSSCVNNDFSCGDRANLSVTEAEHMRETLCESPMSTHRLSLQAVNDCGVKDTSGNGNGNGNAGDLFTGEQAHMHMQTGCLYQETIDLPQNPIPQPSTPIQDLKEKEGYGSVKASYPIRPRKRKAKDAPPAVPSQRPRRKLPSWTKAEEETLKEGVRLYSSDDKKCPWKEILEFGRKVFQKDRTPMDLKDKWRNICRESPAPTRPDPT